MVKLGQAVHLNQDNALHSLNHDSINLQGLADHEASQFAFVGKDCRGPGVIIL